MNSTQLKSSKNHHYCQIMAFGNFENYVAIESMIKSISLFIDCWFKNFNIKIKFSKWIGFWKKNCYRIDSINSMYYPESPKICLLSLQEVKTQQGNKIVREKVSPVEVKKS